MRIVHVTRQFHPARGGLETVVENLAMQQAASGHDVRVVTLTSLFGAAGKLPRADRLGNVEITRISYFGSQRYPIAPSVIMHIRDADVVHVHAIDFFFDFLALTKPIHRKKLVVSTHGGFFHTGFASSIKQLYFALVTRYNISRYAFVAASSEHDLKIFSRIRRHGIEAVVNGVDCKKFSQSVRDEAHKQFIYFGRLAPNKQLHALFPFLKAVRARDPDWRMVIAGRPMDVGIAQLRNEAKAAGLEGQVTLMESPSDDALREAIGRSSVFVSPSHYEGFGIAAIEAMSAGLLPILSDISAHRDTVQTTGMGVLTDFSQPEQAAKAMLEAWRGWGAQRHDQTKIDERLKIYSWAAVAKRFEAIYTRVTGETERRIIGTRVQVTSTDRTVCLIDECVADRRTLRLSFANANLANTAANSPDVAAALDGFHLLNDGIGLDLASLMLFGRFFPGNLNGTDFAPVYLDRSNRKLRLFLLGASERVVAEAAEVYRQRWPQHEVVGFHNGYFSAGDEAAVAERVRAARPDIVLTAMGNPRQELWLAKYVPGVCTVGLAVGALFDFQTGNVPRAPAFIRKMRLEWVYRLLVEPKRLWKRYTFGNALFLGRVALQFARGERA